MVKFLQQLTPAWASNTTVPPSNPTLPTVGNVISSTENLSPSRKRRSKFNLLRVSEKLFAPSSPVRVQLDPTSCTAPLSSLSLQKRRKKHSSWSKADLSGLEKAFDEPSELVPHFFMTRSSRLKGGASATTGPADEVRPHQIDLAPGLGIASQLYPLSNTTLPAVDREQLSEEYQTMSPWRRSSTNAHRPRNFLPTTGPKEQVTPWELFPPSDSYGSLDDDRLPLGGSGLTRAQSPCKLSPPEGPPPPQNTNPPTLPHHPTEVDQPLAFTTKGGGVHLPDGSISSGKRHHSRSAEEAPYPRCYERDVIDLDVWDTLVIQNRCSTQIWHSPESGPAKVLDVGCGTGAWILSRAGTWTDTYFTGLDLVPLEPQQTSAACEILKRIRWIQANFLEGLPFGDNEFDFVHIQRIGLGVPEHQWDYLFKEAHRVMKPGAIIEVIEEDVFFPLCEKTGGAEIRPIKPQPPNLNPALRCAKSNEDLATPSHKFHEPAESNTSTKSTAYGISVLSLFSALGDHRGCPSPRRHRSSPILGSTAHTPSIPTLASNRRCAERPGPKHPPPQNPRNHSLLAYIYHNTLSSKGISTSPTLLLTGKLERHFTVIMASKGAPIVSRPLLPVVPYPSDTRLGRGSVNSVLEATSGNVVVANYPVQPSSILDHPLDRSLRMREILACSESMWEWIHATQLEPGPAPEGQDHWTAVISMKPAEFQRLLMNFEMDMQDRASVHTALAARFDWKVIDSPPSEGRKIFQTACEQYEKWLLDSGCSLAQPLASNDTRTKATRISPSRSLAQTPDPPQQQAARNLHVFIGRKATGPGSGATPVVLGLTTPSR